MYEERLVSQKAVEKAGSHSWCLLTTAYAAAKTPWSLEIIRRAQSATIRYDIKPVF